MNPRVIGLYQETDNGQQVPVFRYWPVPVGVLASKLSSKAKLLLGLIYRHADRGGRLSGWGTRRLGGELGISPRSVRRHRAALVDVGLIEISPGGHSEAPDSYHIQLFHPWMRMPVVHVPSGLVDKLSPAALLVYGWLAWKQGSGSAWRWAVSQVSEATGLGERMVQKARAELETKAFLLCRRLQGRAHAWLLLDHASLGSVLIKGRGVLTAPGGEPTAAAPELSAAGGEPTAAAPELSAPHTIPTTTPTVYSYQESIPIRGGVNYPPRPSAADRSRARARAIAKGDWDAEGAKDEPDIGW